MGCGKPLPIGVRGQLLTAGSGHESWHGHQRMLSCRIHSRGKRLRVLGPPPLAHTRPLSSPTHGPSPPPRLEQQGGQGSALTDGGQRTLLRSGFAFQFFQFCLLPASGPGCVPTCLSLLSGKACLRVCRWLLVPVPSPWEWKQCSGDS